MWVKLQKQKTGFLENFNNVIGSPGLLDVITIQLLTAIILGTRAIFSFIFGIFYLK